MSGALALPLPSNVKFIGQATIMPGWYAGYVLQLEADEHDPLLDLRARVVFGGPTSVDAHWHGFAPWMFSSPTGSSRATTWARSASVCNHPLVTTRRSWLTARVRSFQPTGCMFDNAGFFIRAKNGALSP